MAAAISGPVLQTITSNDRIRLLAGPLERHRHERQSTQTTCRHDEPSGAVTGTSPNVTGTVRPGPPRQAGQLPSCMPSWSTTRCCPQSRRTSPRPQPSPHGHRLWRCRSARWPGAAGVLATNARNPTRHAAAITAAITAARLTRRLSIGTWPLSLAAAAHIVNLTPLVTPTAAVSS